MKSLSLDSKGLLFSFTTFKIFGYFPLSLGFYFFMWTDVITYIIYLLSHLFHCWYQFQLKVERKFFMLF